MGVVASSRRAARLPQQHRAVQRLRRLAGSGSRSPTPHKVMSFLAMDDPAICGCAPWCRRIYPRRIRELEPRSATGPNPSRRGLAVGKFRLHRR
ncbi:putative cytochrome P450, partial [Mycobacterium xenopi 4042]